MVFESIIAILSLNQKKKLITVCLLSILLAFVELFSLSLFVPLIGALIENEVSNNFILSDFINFGKNTEENLIGILILILFIYFIKFIFVNFVTIYSNTFLFNVQEKLRSKLYYNYLNKEYLTFINDNGSYAIRNIMDNTNVFSIGILRSYIAIFSETILVLFFLTFLIYLNPKSAILVTILFGLTALLYFRILKKRLDRWGIDKNFHSAQAIKVLQESLKGFKEIKIFNIFNFFFSKFKNHNKLTLDAQRKFFISTGLSQYYFELVAIISLSIFLVSLSFQNLSGSEALALLGVYGAASFKVLPSFNKILIAINTLKFGKSSILSIRENINDEKKFITNKKVKFEKLSELNLNNINFTYDSNKKIFNNLNINFDKNKVIGIFGESGSGKTTLINLLCGLIKPNNGSINYNNMPIYEDIESYQKKLGVVPQEVFIMDDTIEKNIAIGLDKENIDNHRLENSIDKANLKQLINSLPNKLNTELGENGVFLSGGQKQRIGIARALYKNPEIIIFDESTSSLDEITEDKFIKNVLDLKNSALIIFITHKKRLIKYFDNTYFLEDNSLKKINE